MSHSVSIKQPILTVQHAGIYTAEIGWIGEVCATSDKTQIDRLAHNAMVQIIALLLKSQSQ